MQIRTALPVAFLETRVFVRAGCLDGSARANSRWSRVFSATTLPCCTWDARPGLGVRLCQDVIDTVLHFRSLRESMGVSADQSNRAFPSKDVDNFLDRTRAKIHVDNMERHLRCNTNHFVLAVDPAGGGASAFAVSSMLQVPTGQIIVTLLLARMQPSILLLFTLDRKVS